MLCTLNLQILHDWHHTNVGTEPAPPTDDEDPPTSTPPAIPDETGRPPPGG
jgi:hypothetical protein